jgi:hypothetical protein
MSQEDSTPGLIDVVCPCCGAALTIDRALGKMISHHAPPRRANAPDLGQATQVLEKEARRREALFERSADTERVKTQLLDRKFEEALKKSKDEPATRPLRDIDLD